MPYALSRDESTLLVLDGHGLTRFAPKGRPRTNPRVRCGERAIITVDDDARRGVVWDPYEGQCHELTVSDLFVDSHSSSNLTVVSPAGDERIWTSVLGFRHAPLDPSMEPVAWPDPREIGLTIGPEGPARDDLAERWHRTVEGDFALLREGGGEAYVYVGATSERPWRCAHAWRIGLRGDGLTGVWAEPGGATVVVHDQRSERAHFATVTPTRPTVRFTLATRCLPARRGAQWITQPDDRALVAVDALGAAHARWTLPPELSGAGEIIAGARRALWRSPDGSRLVDLDTGAALTRSLPAATEAFRPQIAAAFARFNAVGAPYGRRFDLLSIRPEARGSRAQVALTMTHGDRSLASWALGAATSDDRAWAFAPSLRPASLGGFSDRGSYVGPIDEAAARELVALFDRASLSLAMIVSSLWLDFERRRLRWCCWHDETRDALVTREGASIAWRALMVHLAAPRGEAPPTLPRGVAQGASMPLTLAEAKASLAAIHPTQRWAYECLVAVALALESLPADDAAPLVVWCDEHLTRDQYHPFWDAWKRLRSRVAAPPR